MNKKLDAIQTQLEDILTKAKNEIDDMEQSIRSANENEAQAAETLLQAREAGDPAAYAKSAADNRTAKDVAEMYSGKIEAIKTKPLITEKEYKGIKEDILKEIQAHSAKTKTKAKELILQLEELRDDLGQEAQKSNGLLHQLQREIYREPKIKEEGGFKMATMDDTYNNDKVLGALNNVVNSYAYTVFNDTDKQ